MKTVLKKQKEFARRPVEGRRKQNDVSDLQGVRSSRSSRKRRKQKKQVEKELFMKAPQVLSQASNEFFFKALMQKAAPYYTMQLHRCRKKHLYCLSHFSVFFLLFNT